MTPHVANWTPQEREVARRYPAMRKAVRDYDRWNSANHGMKQPSLNLVFHHKAKPKCLDRAFDCHVKQWWAHKQIKLADIRRLVVDNSEVAKKEIISPRCDRRIVRARQAAAWLMRKHTTHSLPMIGKALGGRDHSTIMHACRQVDANYDNYRDLIEAVERQLVI